MSGDIIVHTIRDTVAGFSNVRIDRKTPLGNPFWMADESKRDEVCDKFEVYFDKEVEIAGSSVREAMIILFRRVRSGEDVSLQCHCAPKRCHGDKIKQFIERNL